MPDGNFFDQFDDTQQAGGMPPKEQALGIIRRNESGGQNVFSGVDVPGYTVEERGSGYYQMIPSTWQRGAQLVGVDTTRYPLAIDAPFDVQHKVAGALWDHFGAEPWSKNPNTMAQLRGQQNYFDRFDARPAPNPFDRFDSPQQPQQTNALGVRLPGGGPMPQDEGLPLTSREALQQLPMAQTEAQAPLPPVQREETPERPGMLGRIGEAAREGYAAAPPLIDPQSSTGKWLSAHGMEGLTMPFAPMGALNAAWQAATTGTYEGVKAAGGSEQAARDAAGYVESAGMTGAPHVPLMESLRGAAEAKQATTAPGEAPAPPPQPAEASLQKMAQGQPAPEAMPTLERMAAEAQRRNRTAAQPQTPEALATAEAQPPQVTPAEAPKEATPPAEEIPTVTVTAKRPEPPPEEVPPAEAPKEEPAPQPTPEPAPEAAPETAKTSKPGTPFVPVPKAPTRLIEFLRRPQVVSRGTMQETTIPGGLQDTGGDLKAILGGTRGRPGLINNKTGRTLDDAAENAWEAGYFPDHPERPSVNDLLDAIRDDHTGTPRYSEHDTDAVQAFHQAIEHNEEIDRLGSEYGIPTTGINHAAFYDQLHDAMSVGERAREIASQDDANLAAQREFEKGAKDWHEQHPETGVAPSPWNARDFYGQSQFRGLDDLERERLLEESADAESVPYSGVGHAENVGQLGPTNPLIPQGFGGLDVPGKRVVLSNVRAALHDPQVARAVIRLVPVDVMHNLVSGKLSTDDLLHDPSMLVKVLPVDARNAVAADVQAVDVITSALARAATEGSSLTGAETTGRLGELFSAERAGQQHAGQAYQSAEAIAKQSEHAGRAAETGPPGEPAGAGEEGAGPREPGAGPPGRAEAQGPATDLLGTPLAAPRERAAPEPTIRNDPRQIGLIGTEPSAVQAQAARDAGRGTLRGQVLQQEPGGMFEHRPEGQGTLYSFPAALFDPAAWRRAFGPLAPAMKTLRDWTGRASDATTSLIAPMQTSSRRAQAIAADFANSLRQVQYRYGQIDREIERNFTPAERDQMGRALDAQSVFEQQLRNLPAGQQAQARADFDATRTGLAWLTPKQRQVVEGLDAISQDVWRRMQERGMVAPTAQGLPYYMPRQILLWSEAEGFRRPTGGQGGPGREMEPIGQNLTTQGPMRREHLTPEETEAAAQAKLGNEAQLLRDIRSLPSRLAFSERAIRGVDLMDQIDRVGKETGVDLVVRGDIPGMLQPGDYFTISGHPSFRRWTGAGWQAIHVAREFEGGLKAVLSKPGPALYRAAQSLKGGVMSAIMYSPFIHLAVELGRSLPVMPLRVLTLRALRDGSTLRRDLDYMDQATRDGLAPLGDRGWRTDPVSIADQAVGTNGANRFVRALQSMRDAVANGAGRIGGQFLHDVVQHPHATLLWDQVFNLQVGIYDAMRSRYIAKGFDPEVAGTMAAHLANRYAGALPPENLSRGANMAANLLLFSRSFTLGNLGVVKDMMNGAPSHVRARIEQMAGPDVARSAQGALRNKAIAAFVMDVGLFYMANGLLQAGLQQLRGEPAVDDWLDESQHAIAGAKDNPLSIFGVLPQHWNEPGKQDRVYAGTDSEGRGIYLRLPAGKVGEDFLGWFSKPGVMLENKASPLVRPIIESIFGYDTLGRPIYRPNPQTLGDGLGVAWQVVKHIGEGLGPTSTIQGVYELGKEAFGQGSTRTDPWISVAKIAGPATGLAQVSQGFPGGPAAGEMHAESEREKFDLQKALPSIRDKIKAGDIEGAEADMRALNVPTQLQRYYLRQTLRPGPTAGALRRLPGAPADVRERVERQLGLTPP